MIRTASISGASSHDLSALNALRPPSMQRTSSHPTEPNGPGTPLSTDGAANFKPSPLVMPQPIIARSNSISISHRPPGSPMALSLQSPSPPLGYDYNFQNLVIEENVRSLLIQVV